MANGTIPSADAALLAWGLTFKTRTATGFATYGLASLDATTFATKYDSYASALAVATDPETRSPANISQKDALKTVLLSYARQLGRKVQGTASVTPTQKIEIGLSPRTAARTPNPPPAFAPALSVESVTGRTARVRLRDAQNPDSRGKPSGCFGATVMSAVSPTQPTSIDAFRIEGIATRNVFEVTFPEDVADGAKVWFVALWNSTRGQNGPACAPVGTNLAGGVLNVIAGVKVTPQKKAA